MRRAREREGGRAVLLLRGAEETPGAALVRDAARRHGAVRHPLVPPLLAAGAGDGAAWAVLDAPAHHDVAELARALPLTGSPLTWPIAIAMLWTLLDALCALEEQTGEAVHAAGLCNLVWGETGTATLLIPPPAGTQGSRVHRVEAPEYALLGEAHPSAHPYLAWAARQPLAELGEVPEVIARVLSGQADPDDPFSRAITTILLRVAHPSPAERYPRSRDALDAYGAALALVDVRPDFDGMEHLFRAAAARLPPQGEGDFRLTLAHGRATLPDGRVLDLVRSSSARRLIERLVVTHVDDAHRAVGQEELLRAGWPHDRVRGTSARNKLHVALSRLRSAGFDGLIEHTDEGWRLHPLLEVEVLDGDGPP